MINDRTSPRQEQRLRLLQAYRGRNSRNANLFLVYSVKMAQDWILASDWHFIYWIHYLETDPRVKAYSLRLNTVKGVPQETSDDIFADVELRTGSREQHALLLNDEPACQLSQRSAGTVAQGNVIPPERRVFSIAEVQPYTEVCIRWLKPLAYAATLRNNAYPRETAALIGVVSSAKNGVIGDIVANLEPFGIDSAVAFGLLTRLAISGRIQFDLSAKSFGYATPWKLNVWDGNHVE